MCDACALGAHEASTKEELGSSMTSCEPDNTGYYTAAQKVAKMMGVQQAEFARDFGPRFKKRSCTTREDFRNKCEALRARKVAARAVMAARISELKESISRNRALIVEGCSTAQADVMGSRHTGARQAERVPEPLGRVELGRSAAAEEGRAPEPLEQVEPEESGGAER